MFYKKILLKEIDSRFTNETTSLRIYISERNESTEQRPGMLVCPGGGYSFCSAREAEPIAFRFLSEGFNCFILDYTVYKATVGNYIATYNNYYTLDNDRLVFSDALDPEANLDYRISISSDKKIKVWDETQIFNLKSNDDLSVELDETDQNYLSILPYRDEHLASKKFLNIKENKIEMVVRYDEVEGDGYYMTGNDGESIYITEPLYEVLIYELVVS